MTSPLINSTARVALVGDRSPSIRAHTRIPDLLDGLAKRDHLVLDAYWIPTEDAESADDLSGFDAIWLLPGSPYRSEAGALTAVRTAREHGIPFLGTCAGFQHAVLEFARNVCGLTGVDHAENQPEATDLMIVPLACSLVGHEGAVQIAAGSLAEQVLGAERSLERYHCAYGINPAYLRVLRSRGLRFSGVDEAGDMRIAELPDHPFFLATLFQPELAGDGTRPHPIIRALATAAVKHAGKNAGQHAGEHAVT
jgi:CTP synthase (UTP-ammonia lyase)